LNHGGGKGRGVAKKGRIPLRSIEKERQAPRDTKIIFQEKEVFKKEESVRLAAPEATSDRK